MYETANFSPCPKFSEVAFSFIDPQNANQSSTFDLSDSISVFLPRQILNVRHVGVLILVHVTAAKIVTQVNFRWNLAAIKTSVHSITQTDRLYRKPRRLHFGSKKPTEAILSKFGLFGVFFFSGYLTARRSKQWKRTIRTEKGQRHAPSVLEGLLWIMQRFSFMLRTRLSLHACTHPKEILHAFRQKQHGASYSQNDAMWTPKNHCQSTVFNRTCDVPWDTSSIHLVTVLITQNKLHNLHY